MKKNHGYLIRWLLIEGCAPINVDTPNVSQMLWSNTTAHLNVNKWLGEFKKVYSNCKKSRVHLVSPTLNEKHLVM